MMICYYRLTVTNASLWSRMLMVADIIREKRDGKTRTIGDPKLAVQFYSKPKTTFQGKFIDIFKEMKYIPLLLNVG